MSISCFHRKSTSRRATVEGLASSSFPLASKRVNKGKISENRERLNEE